jgi:hypothetical protein
MLSKPIFILLLGLVLGYVQPQAGPSLPDGLSETEEQMILREQSPKPHVEKALKVAETRVTSALKLAQQSRYNPAAQEVDVFSSLIVYADAYTRRLPNNQSKDRNHCLKRIEQTVFKQTRTIEAIMRELPVEAREALEPGISEVKKIRLRAINDLLGGGRVMNSSNE